LRDDGHVIAENGYEAYPLGPARNLDSVQRGSVLLLSIYPGDPYTPGRPAYENATRQEPYNMAAIPSLPISWNNAARLLEELGGVDEGRKVNGKSSEREIRLVNRGMYIYLNPMNTNKLKTTLRYSVDNHIAPMWNIMASIPGIIKDEVVVIGCHHDAWVGGYSVFVQFTINFFYS
jgi:N-acetylated-alpha-linked acidic dipeptidase